MGSVIRAPWWAVAVLLCGLPGLLWAAAKPADVLAGMKLRGIGPAFMSGRIADIAIDPVDASTWYVGVGSGGVSRSTSLAKRLKSSLRGVGSGGFSRSTSHAKRLKSSLRGVTGRLVR